MKKGISIGNSRSKLVERSGWGNSTLQLITFIKIKI